MGSDGKGKLTLNKSSEYKNIEVVSLDLSPENEENIEEKISFKYGQLKRKPAQSEERLSKIEELIRIVGNPTLLTQIVKTSPNFV